MSWVDDHEPDDEEVQSVLDDLYGELKGVRVNTTKKKGRPKLDHKRKGAPGRSPVIDYIRSLGDYRSTGEVAKEIGKSQAWVRKAAAKRWTQAPSYVAPFGNTRVNLYTEEDVDALKAYIDTHHKVYKREDFPYDKES